MFKVVVLLSLMFAATPALAHGHHYGHSGHHHHWVHHHHGK